MHLILLLSVVAIASLGLASSQDRLDCEYSCGNVSITYPFGSREGCYYSPDFLITCDQSSAGEPIPFFKDNSSNVVITNMNTSKGEMEIQMFVASDCYNSSGRAKRLTASLSLMDFRISTKNRFIAIGWDTQAFIAGALGNDIITTGCTSICDDTTHITNGSCSGVGCCEIAVPKGMSTFAMSIGSSNNHTKILEFNPCSYAFLVEEGKYDFSSHDLLDFQSDQKMRMVLDWAIGNDTCDTVNKEADNFLCKSNSTCDQNYTGPGYRCRCLDGYKGNPYTKVGCKNIDECEDKNHGCTHKCIDKEGYYECKCRKGYSGDGKIGGSGCRANRSLLTIIAICTSAAAIFLLVSVTWLYFGIKKHRLIILREKFFKQNGGIMLQQRISGDGGSHDQAKVFTIEELKKATNNYDESRIIGKGGYGTVYKGVLSDNRIVAIKKSKLPEQSESQIEQFINEVVILSQINHRNVVKLIGCCLETEVPLLVYEFIPNGTLSDHIHNESKSLAITWDIRLRIATETAEALSYLHSAASVPIIHRDIKPMNILLDDNYVAKVADFGASRLIPMDQIELATIVQGTLGYLDPEYMHTSQLTDKSDVYSFGVVLTELFTGREALSFARPEEERNLAMYFLSSLKEGRLFQILDEHLQLNEVPSEIVQVSRLAERCLKVRGDERPTMKEVAMELERILASVIHKHLWVQGTSNEEEAEYLLREPNEEYEYTNGANTSSSTFDSMSKQTILPIASGR
ncbi:wall-associated receptor kinase 2-like [Bidens hawaiensis]|uniref:wall-associated receptor kinase 2-like n=1 Tax=Bidens hawaiensis TaxID=980011 RepID=UPI00404AD602